MKPIFYINLLIFSIFFSFVSCNKKELKETEPKQKNVVFILVDDYGYNDMSFRNNSFYETPNIDQLAKESMVFNEGYATCQVCSPSRASIMNGKFPARHGITDWIGAREGEEWRKIGRQNQLLPAKYVHELAAENITLPEALKENGYTTFFAGKWHLGNKGSWPEDHGFDINKGGFEKGGPKGGFFAPYKNPNLTDGKDGENLTMRLAQETADFITNHDKEKPFFAFLSFYAVHAPIETTEEKWSKYRQKAIENGVAETGFEMGHFFPIRQVQDNPVYAGLVETMDDAVGVVTKRLKDLGLDENTIVIFTSDNGGVSAGDAYATSNLPLRGGKGYQYEGGIKEPYLIKVPWLKTAGKENNTPVTGTDFYPTILELLNLNLKPEEHNDGKSLLPLLKGKQIDERSLIWHYPHYGNQGGQPSSIIRKGDWKLIHYYENGHEELYNLKSDMIEQNDVSTQNSELTKQLSTELFDYLEEVGARFPERDPLYDAEKEKAHLQRMATTKLQQLEQQRLKFLEEDFEPNADWWGSKITVD